MSPEVGQETDEIDRLQASLDALRRDVAQAIDRAIEGAINETLTPRAKPSSAGEDSQDRV